MTEAVPLRTSGVSALGWACFLAASWTWCIGMFLPVLLIRDFGSPGFWAFLVPNVVGAGAMGWVLWGRGRAEKITVEHRAAASVFSAVTLAFQAFFIGWLATRVGAWSSTASWAVQSAWVMGAVVLVATWVCAKRPNAIRWLAALLIFFGLAVLGTLWFVPAYTPDTAQFARAASRFSDLLWIAPMMAFGFALCPYLDLTFLRARSATSINGARVAFTVGFGVLFAAMLGLTFVYAGLFIANLTPADHAVAAPPWVWAILLTHLAMQAAFTLALHARAAEQSSGVGARTPLLILALGAFFVGFFSDKIPGAGGLTGAEVAYRAFLGCYGLVFPAYVWLVMIPTRDGHAGLTGANGRRKLLILAFTIGSAMPLTWMAFIERDEFYAVPGLLIVLFARLALPRRELAATSRRQGLEHG